MNMELLLLLIIIIIIIIILGNIVMLSVSTMR